MRPHAGGPARVWTDDTLARVRETLGRHRTIAAAAAELGMSASGIQSAFWSRREALGGQARDFLMRSSAPVSVQPIPVVQGSAPQVAPQVTPQVAPQVEPRNHSEPPKGSPYAGAATIMGTVARSIFRFGVATPGRHRVAHATDIHFGSKHCNGKALLDFMRLAVDAGCEAVICTGDTLDGNSQKILMEQRAIGFDDQAAEAVEIFAAAKLKIPVVAISGNHDSYFNDTAGLESGRVLQDRMQAAGVPWHYIGSCMGRAIVYGAKVVLYHPHGGGATRNAVRRVLNAKAEAYEEHDRPDIIFGGHFHKHAAVHAYPEDILCVGGGTFQERRSDFGIRMIHPWDIGGGIVSWTVSTDGRVHEKAAEFYPVRTEAVGWEAA